MLSTKLTQMPAPNPIPNPHLSPESNYQINLNS